MLDHNQFHWLNCKEINCVYAYLWTELAETIANVIKKKYHGTGKSKHRKIHPEIKTTEDIGYMAV